MPEKCPTVTTENGNTDLLRRYVHILLARMAQGNQQEIALARSEPLPDPFIPAAKQLPEGIDYASVVGELQAATHGYEPDAEYAASSQCDIEINGRAYDLGVKVKAESCMVTLAPRG